MQLAIRDDDLAHWLSCARTSLTQQTWNDNRGDTFKTREQDVVGIQ
jgi:hypothetical protein